MTRIRLIRQKYRRLQGSLNERGRRLWAATEARALGYGGASLVARAIGISRSTIVRGMREARSGKEVPDGDRIRRPGAGRKRATAIDRDLLAALDRLIDPVSRGDLDAILRFTCKSTHQLARELTSKGHPASDWLVRRLLHDLGYGLHAHRKTYEGARHPDRDAQFRHLHARVQRQQRLRQPAIWVDLRKKERGLARDRAWVTVAVDDDTAPFAVSTILRWWKETGSKVHPRARSLLIVAGWGGSDGNRVQRWKWELQRLADATRLTVHVCHLPRGTWKWSAIEQHLCSISVRQRHREPLPAHATTVSLILEARASTGPKARCILDRRRYPIEVRVTEAQRATIRLTPDSLHGDWNYFIQPHDRRASRTDTRS